jgi:DNA-binding PadR family transcriptional regulator
MFRDHSLVPAEAIRLVALGLLAETPRRYFELAKEIRHFTSRIVGPSPELMGTSLEVLRYEGLIETKEAGANGGDPELRLTAAGQAALTALLRAGVRAPTTDLARLGLMLKLRFLNQLPAPEQTKQLDLVIAACASELARLEDLRGHNGTTPELFLGWLDRDIAEFKARISWLEARRVSLPDDGGRGD